MIIYITYYLIFIFSLNFYIKKKKLLKSNTGSVHQTFANHSAPLVGGGYIFLPLVFFYFNEYQILFTAFISFFLLGLFSDLNIIRSAKKRFFLQISILFLFIYFSKIEITSTRLDLLDIFLENFFINYFFTSFCLIVLINGSNFIDGLNSLLLTYLALILFFLFKLDLFDPVISLNSKEACLTIILIFIIIMNFFNQLFLGDSGSYSLSFLIGVILINTYNLNPEITPYFIILLLWYPCFENLFSIFRKIISRKDPLKPDNEHLHYLLYTFLRQKLNISRLKSNNFSSISINLFNLIIFYISSLNIYHTGYQLNIILFSTIFYCLIFYILKKNSKP